MRHTYSVFLRIVSFSVLCLLWNCSHDSVNLLTSQTIEIKYKISIDEAVIVAQKYVASSTSNPSKTGKIDASNDIFSQETVSDENNRSLFYVINYSKGGFAIISADMRAMPILAYSSSGNKFDNKNAPLTNGLGIWYNAAKNQMKNIISSSIIADSTVIKEWKKYLSNSITSQKGARISAIGSMNTNTTCQAYYTTGQYMCHYSSYFSHNSDNPNVAGPILSYPGFSSGVEWGQSHIANMYAPTAGYPACTNDNEQGYCGRYPAGCGPVAMAQVMWYFNRGSSGYSSMPQISNGNLCSYSDPGSTALASLMVNCGNAAQSYYGISNTCNTLTFPGKIPSALQIMGLSNGGSVGSFDPSRIETEVYQGYPIIFFATNSEPAVTGFDRHIWVCDSFDEHKYSDYNCDTGYCDQWSYLYLYMNWGFDGDSNGWYASGNFAPNPPQGSGSSGNYNQNVQMISGIRR